MDVSQLSDDQLRESLQKYSQSRTVAAGETTDELRAVVEELQVHRVELEMQNRALRETQAELEQSVTRFADLYDHLPVGYVTVTMAGRIVEANDAAAQCLQTDRHRLRDLHLRRYLDPFESGRLAAHLEQLPANGALATIELPFRLPDGTRRLAQLTCRRAPPLNGEEPRVHVAITEISQLREAQRVLDRINADQAALSSAMSHDLRSPVVTIGSYARVLLEEHAAALPEEAASMLARIERAAVRMEDTVRNLQIYSSLATDEIDLETLSLDEIVADCVRRSEALIAVAGAEVTLVRPLGAVRASRAMVERICTTLLANALKFTAPGIPPRIAISSERVDRALLLRIRDNGIGIDARHHERIFGVAERLHGHSQYPGSGMGLAIARRAAERTGGQIWVESESGKGSCFCVRLPAAD
jgi:PAS domain S-box-containing protein